MADEVDKFVLEYQVNLKDSISRLERLNREMGKTEKAGANSQSGFAKFGRNLNNTKNEITGVGSSVNSLVSSFGKVSPAIAGAGAAVLTLTAAMRIAVQTSKQLNEQLMIGQRNGMSGLSVETFQRAASNASGGRIGGSQAQSMIDRMGRRIQAAYSDPLQNSADARMLRMAGVNVNGKYGQISADQGLEQLSRKLASMNKEQGDALAMLLGYTQQEAAALRQMGGEMSKAANMTEGQARAYVRASDAAQKFDASMGKAKEQIREASNNIGELLLPALASMAEAISSMAKTAKGVTDTIVDNRAAMDTLTAHERKLVTDVIGETGTGFDPSRHGMGFVLSDETKAALDKFYQAQGQQRKPVTNETKASIDKLGEQQQQTFGAQGDLSRAISTFSSAVAQFSASVNENQAWAAWAGELGAAAGLNQGGGNGSGGSVSYNASAASAVTAPAAALKGKNVNTYDAWILDAAKREGVDPMMVKRIISHESQFDPNAVSGAGATGLGQIMPATARGYGIDQSRLKDPKTSIDLTAKVWKDALKRQNGNETDALMDYNAGPNKKRWNNAETQAYPGLVMSQGVSFGGAPVQNAAGMNLSASQIDAMNPNAKGTWTFTGGKRSGSMVENRKSLRQTMVAQSIASATGVPVAQVQQGMMSGGDFGWSAGEVYTSLINEKARLLQERQAPGLTDIQRRNIDTQLRNNAMGIQSMTENAGALGAGMQAGSRDMTLGENRQMVVNGGINITVNAQDGKDAGKQIAGHLSEMGGEVVNSRSYPLKN
ncbi:lytic transglycosylase domain-containing protein [Burkholderia cenocepacia]|uniref:lytic transglycosylase domain-containing protein n=1 Tax=Burkholderia cenocepacia TaxID=95486 RepID=UPI0020A1AC6A|nr:lytic transglycosylase domain-containing protein [Burkholderia cenocepacia]MCO8321488.1 lytic transglycosylase domain-containing protein [Burkholderia cenocepacia]MCO8328772.1 lytic transglycosylase domain-containing protein [Burkholderia cenocepacia]MCO8336058.1 lytic transglycosylase domain-containing protein [Burkholderia cenocepacia]MCO8343343.1 lytic transglycosylase domain-containing protein [Burkholderia cenocepacia]MCO8356625.1 lytic transglycosylase domain-containing protein [Burkh